ncbi:hypothetical protein QL285_062402 [Trifolium repens]|nr:hypothetical protein QL285_062402 [Trifolium repens]
MFLFCAPLFQLEAMAIFLKFLQSFGRIRSVSPHPQLSGWRLIYQCSFIERSDFTPNLYSCMSLFLILSSRKKLFSEVTLQTGFPDCSSSSLMAFLYSLVIFSMVPVSPNHSCNSPFFLLLPVEALVK